MKLILTAMALTIAATIATPVAAQAGPTSPPHAAVPHGGAPAADAATPPRHVHRGPNVVEQQAPVEGAPAGGMACCQHEATEGAAAPAAGGCCCCRHGAEGAPADAGADHSGHAGHGG